MAKTPEGKVKDAIDEYLKTLGANCWFYAPVPFGYGRQGVPDRIICYRGFFIAVEAKAPGKELNATPWQQRELEGIRGAGGRAIVASDVVGLRNIIQHIDETLSRKMIPWT